MSLVQELRVPLIGRPETEHEWAKSNTETTPYMFWDSIYFIQMALHTKASLWKAESQDVPYIRAAPSWSALQLSLLLHKRLLFRLAGLHLRAPYPAFLQESIKQHVKQLHGGIIVSTNQYVRAETTQPLAYHRPRGNSWQHTVHEVFKKLPAVPPELLL